MASCNKSAISSSGSNRTTATSASAARVRAKAEAAKVRASYASQEAKLKMEKAAKEAERQTREAQNKLETTRIETELEVLTLHREADAAMVEAQVWEDAEEKQIAMEKGNSVSDEVKWQRTTEYVQSQVDLQTQSSAPLEPVPKAEIAGNLESQAFKMLQPTINELRPTNSKPNSENGCEAQRTSKPPSNLANLSEPTRAEPKFRVKRANSPTNLYARFHTPQGTPLANTPPAPDTLAQYLARRDLVTSGLYQFDDKPENFRAWQSSFTNAVAEVSLTATQELDVMTKWLGRQSGEQVRRIRSVYINNPILALNKAWERLHDCYACPEIIEQSLFQRLDSFPKIAAKDHAKLRELGDLLMELQGAKEDGFLTGLSYLDTSRGISPIVDKLPYGLQEKWVSAGSWYKGDNQGRFPPFDYFCDFVNHEAKKRNDPSFIHQGNNATFAKSERPTVKNFSSSKPITVHKTDVSTVTNDPSKYCPVHNKPHPLKKCRTFRNKTLVERKAFLKEKGICFKCCSSISHLTKDCKYPVKCSECDSSYHDAVMHPDTLPQTTKGPPPPQENGGEGEDHSDVSDVTTSCTEVCGKGQWGRSCSKICLAKIYPKGFKDEAIKVYVILDDKKQSLTSQTRVL